VSKTLLGVPTISQELGTAESLDLTEVYAPNGEFLGLETVQGLIPFVYGIPDEFRILARTEALVDQIREIFNRKNS
jgi:hypothetical protein